jgi:hypothetical protein
LLLLAPDDFEKECSDSDGRTSGFADFMHQEVLVLRAATEGVGFVTL